MMTTHFHTTGGDDDDQNGAKPVQQPGEIETPEGVGTILGSESEEKENRNLL